VPPRPAPRATLISMRRLSWLALLAVLAPLPGCSRQSDLSSLVRPTGLKVLLVGIDGATYRVLDPLLDREELPVLASLIERGSRGTLASVPPMLSPALWTEILTGKRREVHGITDFVVPVGPGRRLVEAGDRRCLALWNIASACGLTSGMIGFWATWPAEPVRGFVVSDRAARGRFTEWLGASRESALTWPPELMEELTPLLVDPLSRDLSDLAALVPLAPENRAELLAVEKPIFGHPWSVLAFAFRAQRSYENIALYLLPREQPDLSGVFLVANDPVSHTFWHQREPAAFSLAETDASRRLARVFEGISRHNDAFLGELLGRLDESTVMILVSDHGFQASGVLPRSFPAERFQELRAEALARGQVAVGQSGMHHEEGVLIAAGGPVKRGAVVRANLADVTPTILHLLGLPVGRDMKGRVLEELLEESFLTEHPVRTIDSYEGRIERRVPVASSDERALREELEALGYVR